MEVYMTYCSGTKSTAEGEIPAVERYRSSRINRVRDIAKNDDKEFYILSGLFGAIHSTQPIPYYDHLLVEDEVDELIAKVVEQIKGLDHVVFYTMGEEVVKPYEDTIERACEIIGATVEFKNPFEG